MPTTRATSRNDPPHKLPSPATDRVRSGNDSTTAVDIEVEDDEASEQESLVQVKHHARLSLHRLMGIIVLADACIHRLK